MEEGFKQVRKKVKAVLNKVEEDLTICNESRDLSNIH